MVRAKSTLPKLAELPSVEADIQELLYKFERAVAQGSPMTFTTFKTLWMSMQFSFIFETRKLQTTHEDFIQSLFASALDCLEVPLRPKKRQCLSTSSTLPLSLDIPLDSSAQVTAGQSSEELPSDATPSLAPLPTLSLAELAATDSDSDSEDEQLFPSQAQGTETALAALPGSMDHHSMDQQGHLEGGVLGHWPEISEQLLSPLKEDLLSEEAISGSGKDLQGTIEGSYLCSGEEVRAYEGNAHEGLQQSYDAHIVRVGSIFMLYALFHAQPRSHIVRIYVPLHLLRGLTWMATQSQEAAAVLRKLHDESALVIGSVRRPISGTKEARLAGYPAKLLLRPDRLEQQRVMGQGFSHLRNSVASWSSLQHIQLLCNSYRSCQEKLWGGQQQEVQGVFDTQTGTKLASAAKKLQLQGVRLWQQDGCFQGLPGLANISGTEEDEKGKRDKTREIAGPVHGSSLSLASGKASLSKEEAAARRRARFQAMDSNEEMPSLTGMPSLADLGASVAGNAGPEMSEAEVKQLPKMAQAVLERQRAEADDQRSKLNSWSQAIKGLLMPQGETPVSASQAKGEAPLSCRPDRVEASVSNTQAQAQALHNSHVNGNGQAAGQRKKRTILPEVGVQKRGEQGSDTEEQDMPGSDLRSSQKAALSVSVSNLNSPLYKRPLSLPALEPAVAPSKKAKLKAHGESTAPDKGKTRDNDAQANQQDGHGTEINRLAAQNPSEPGCTTAGVSKKNRKACLVSSGLPEREASAPEAENLKKQQHTAFYNKQSQRTAGEQNDSQKDKKMNAAGIHEAIVEGGAAVDGEAAVDSLADCLAEIDSVLNYI